MICENGKDTSKTCYEFCAYRENGVCTMPKEINVDRLTSDKEINSGIDIPVFSENAEHWINIYYRLKEYEDTGFTPEEIRKLHKNTRIDVGQTVWIVTRYASWKDWEVVECKVTRKTNKIRSSFSVEGHYGSIGGYNVYNGTFVENSIGKTVFLNKNDAEKECKRKNKKKRIKKNDI